MKMYSRLASLLTGAMLALNSIGAQAYFSDEASEPVGAIGKVGMTKLYTFEMEDIQKWREKNAVLLSAEQTDEENPNFVDFEWNSEDYTIPNDIEGDTLWINIDLKNAAESTRISMEFNEIWVFTEEKAKVEDGHLLRARTVESVSGSTWISSYGSAFSDEFSPYCCPIKVRKNNNEKMELFSFTLEGSVQTPTDIDAEITVYGKKKTDTPDPAITEITGTTTGTAAVGGYEPDYQPFITDENGSYYFRGTNTFAYSVLDIRNYPKRDYAVGEPLSTDGLEVFLTEYRLYNQCECDISDCLQIQTDYDPYTPGEYVVYIRTDYTLNFFPCNDYVFYTVRVDENLTTAETTETTDSLSQPVLTPLRGDVDCSGQVLLARYVAEDAVTVTSQGLVNAELDGEAGLTAGDLSVLLQGIAGSITL